MLGAVLCVAGQVYREPPYLGRPRPAQISTVFSNWTVPGRRKFRTGASSPAPCFSGAGRGPRAKAQVEGQRVPALYQGFYWPVLPASPWFAVYCRVNVERTALPG